MVAALLATPSESGHARMVTGTDSVASSFASDNPVFSPPTTLVPSPLASLRNDLPLKVASLIARHLYSSRYRQILSCLFALVLVAVRTSLDPYLDHHSLSM